MTGENEGVVGRWSETYEKVIEREKELREELKRVEKLLEETKKAAYIVDTTKLQQKKKSFEEALKTTREKRLKLEWMAINHIKNGDWDPRALAEYEFVRDLLLLNKIREEQIREVCQNCNECSIIRVKTTSKDLPLEAVVGTTRGLPYLPLYSLIEIRENRLKEMEVKERFLGALTDVEKKEIEKRIRDKLALSRDVLNCIMVEKKVPLDEKIVLRHRKYGCHRKLPKWLPITTNTEIDSDPKVPDHFVEDAIADIDDDGRFLNIRLAPKHGSEEA